MELTKQNWTKSAIMEFQSYLNSIAGTSQKQKWEQNIVQTKLPCLAIKAPEIRRIIDEIAKGNFISFIEQWHIECHQNIIIIGGLICKIRDFDTLKNYLKIYATKCDNWAATDTLKFKITAKNEQQFFALAKQYIKSPLPFKRRIGIIILFKFINDRFIDKIFSILDGFRNEQQYYVNMANAWLLCECFIKQRDKTLAYLPHHNLNTFTINKAISKCRDSFRVCKEDKQMLLKFKK